MALDADGAIFEILRQGRRSRDFKRGLSHADSAASRSHRLAQENMDMNQQPARRDAPGPISPASRPAEARKLAESLMEVMSGLLAVIERETELVRAGKLHEAMQLEPQKSEHARRYTLAVESLKNSQTWLKQFSPDLLTTIKRHHDTFRAMLQINLTVLATAHAVYEGI